MRSILARLEFMVREVADRLSVHVIRRGNNRGHIFGDDYDREMFLAQLEAASIHHAVDVNAFALMSNHYHAIMTVPDNGCLSLLYSRSRPRVRLSL